MVGEFGWFAGDSLFGLVSFGRLFGGCCAVWFWVVGEFGGLRLWLATFGLCALGFDLVAWVGGFAFGWLWWFVYLAGLRFGCWCLTVFVGLACHFRLLGWCFAQLVWGCFLDAVILLLFAGWICIISVGLLVGGLMSDACGVGFCWWVWGCCM